MTIYDFLGSKIAKSTFFQFFQYKSLWFCFKSELWLFSAFFWGVKRFCSSKIADFRIFDRFFYVWTLATSATSRGRNFSLSNLNRVPNFSKICQLSYEILLVGLEWKWGGVRGRFPKWVDSTPPRFLEWPKSPVLLGLIVLGIHNFGTALPDWVGLLSGT